MGLCIRTMKYLKGTFNTIPNKNHLRGKPAEMQSIFFWIVDHANEEGTCFPSRKTLANESGCNIKTVDKYIAQLIEEGFISKTLRRQEGSKKRSSNFYQLLIVSTESGSNQDTENGSNESTEMGAVTIPILTTTQLSIVEPPKKVDPIPLKNEIPPYSFEVELEKLGKSKWKVDLIIYNLWVKKGLRFENLKQFNSARSRSLRAGKQLEGYTAQQINKTMDFCEQNYKDFGWSLETVCKRIGDLINKK